MGNQNIQIRLERIYQMLFEMAAGNFNYQIENTFIDDELEALVILVNMVAEELRSNVFHNGFINAHFTYQYLIQNSFILNQDLVILCFNAEAAVSLGFTTDELNNALFSGMLSQDSLIVWNLLKDSLNKDPDFFANIQLSFKSKNGLLIPAFCTITRLLHSSKIIISSVNIVVNHNGRINPVLLNISKQHGSQKRYDAKLIQKLYDYILANLDNNLPSVKELSFLFATNEHKLKDGFRYFFKTSIYQFYNDERLKRAHLLIQQTNLPLKSIAYMSGFNIYSNFSKAFKKKFSYSPNMLQRNVLNNENPDN